MFQKYQHIERCGTSEVEGIELGECYVFPKIDGTNASLWYEDGKIMAGSRRRRLTEDNDNAGFYREMHDPIPIQAFFAAHPNLRLFGEWLVPHSLKTYREDAWRRFYVFDVVRDPPEKLPSGEKFEYLPYAEYQPLMEGFGIDYIPPIRIINNPDYDKLVTLLEANDFLIEDGKGHGEGIVIKNYSFVNRYGRTTWAKIVTSEFKEKHSKVMGAPTQEGKDMIELKIADEFCTKALVEKTLAKITVDLDGWSSKMIPQLLGRVYHDLVSEDIWEIVKKYKQPRIDFKRLNGAVIRKIKEVKPDLF